MLELIYQVFQKNGFDHFVDMMPPLHNYVTVDTPAFLSSEHNLLAMYNMAKAVSITSTTLHAIIKVCINF